MATKSIEALLHTAEHLNRYGFPVPVDVLSRLLEAGVSIKKFT